MLLFAWTLSVVEIIVVAGLIALFVGIVRAIEKHAAKTKEK